MHPARIALALLLTAGVAPAQTLTTKKPAKATADKAPAIGQVLDRQLANLEREFVPAAEALPEDKFKFAPTNGEFKGVKTFAQQVKHVSAVNYFLGSQILGEKPPAEVGNPEMGPDTLKSKAEIVKYMKDSFAYARKAIQSVTAQNGSRSVKNPFGQGPDFTPIGMATLLAFHGMDHYGQMVVYLRMNGIIPPASRK